MKPRVIDRGFSLVGTMVGVALGMVAMLAALAMFQVMRDGYASVADSVMIEERGQRALAIVSHAVRQSGWIPALVASAPAQPSPLAPVEGRDDCALPALDTDLHCARAGVSGSDTLLVRLSGSGLTADPTLPDHTMADCSGYALPAQAARDDNMPPPFHAAINLFYIGIGDDGVPQLLCRYPRRQRTRILGGLYTAGTPVRGVETMQLRYGVDEDGDGEADHFMTARSLLARDAAAWHSIRAVQIALVVRGERPTVSPGPVQPLAMLPPLAGSDAADDERFLPATHPNLRRRVFATTVRLRNPSPCEASTC